MNVKTVAQKREMLARKNQGRRLQPELLSKLTNALGRTVEPSDLLDIDKTDDFYEHSERMLTAATPTNPFAFRHIWISNEREDLRTTVLCFEHAAKNTDVIVFLKGFEYTGGLRIDLYTALKHCFELIQIDGDGLCFVEVSKNNGFLLDTYEEREISDQVYELVVWGTDWAQQLRRCSFSREESALS